ncbi:PREDICTED: PHD finger protein EHD3-like [Nelumbo nucifera]|uniref:PHD finger protein EHD3-like n=1 Tax=Nelumbo nucifera TaxID=4432 RepID=A0A1U8Q7V8_NELNU|nr:PREDICTED: PHD finger protein EHD3-like [Nelumbo nucifera]
MGEMLVEERTCNGESMDCSLLAPCSNGAILNGYAFGFGGDNTNGNLGVSSSEGIRTYKRRKQLRLTSVSNLQEDGRISVETAGQFANKAIKKPGDMVLLRRNSNEQTVPNGSNDCTNAFWRNIVLEQISQSLGESEGGVRSCIREALRCSSFGFASMPKMQSVAEKTTWGPDSVECNGDSQRFCSQLHGKTEILDIVQNAAKVHTSATSNESQNETSSQANVHHVSELCQQIFLKIIVSEKFSLLCKLLCENFPGVKVDSFIDFSVINSRMKEGAYGQSPIHFCTDIQQVWGRLQRIGAEMVSLAKSLANMSQTTYREQAGGMVNGTSEEGKHVESDLQKLEKAEDCATDKVCKCTSCGAKTEGKNLVCDACEQAFHIRCIEPVFEEIPPIDWFCDNCTASGIESLQDNCLVCGRLNDTMIQTHGGGNEIVPIGEELLSDLEERSDCSEGAKNGLQPSSRNRRHFSCKLCGSRGEEGQKHRLCGHPFCLFKYYHVKCLTIEQLKSHGPHWYCPSCLCRVCLTDRDDEKIVLCDGCDEAYHIYCMEPPRTSIPRGKWFCIQCKAGIEAIRKAKKAYEDLEKQKMKQLAIEAVGSVDMLLNAAEKLKCEERLASTVRKK